MVNIVSRVSTTLASVCNFDHGLQDNIICDSRGCGHFNPWLHGDNV